MIREDLLEITRKQFVIQDHNGNFYLAKVFNRNPSLEVAKLYLIEKDGEKIIINRDFVALCNWKRLSLKRVELSFYVCKDFRGQGLGSELVDFAKKYAYEQGYQHAYLGKLNRRVAHPLFANMEFDGNLHLYLKKGFKEIPEKNRFLGYLNMYCDLKKERKNSLTQNNLEILKNETNSYLEKNMCL